ncbi:MAG TPA: glycoside hydrolase family 130 protein [Acidimicrobiales bacterium]|nr:glycoside hydrolase family 130 protein [Acidimicrobiales bacterium]
MTQTDLATDPATDLATRRGQRLAPDPGRVVARLFVPGQGLVPGHESRASRTIERVLTLDEAAVERSLADVMRRFAARHRDLRGTFGRHADRVAERVDTRAELSDNRRQLLGAMFTSEYTIEAAALCNPSIVPHPDQDGIPAGSLRFVMSVRGIGEGHRSTVGFRTGTVSIDGAITVDAPGPFPLVGWIGPGPLYRDVFRGKLCHECEDGANAAVVLDRLGERFGVDDLEQGIQKLRAQSDTRPNAEQTIGQLHAIAASSYTSAFPTTTELSERVLWPATGVESRGMEDARFVRFVDDDGTVTYYASYTAYDGTAVTQQLIETTDFATFTSSPIVGGAAANKGLALFPRRIDGRFAAVSRYDEENNAVAFSDDPRRWDHAVTCQFPQQPWETIQMGNCGPPIETDDGWLVLTHGVGPMRTYSIGALLLDLDDPTRVIGRLPQPLLSPAVDEQDGYVPNVVYSCGSLRHGENVVIPYAIADTAIGFASIRLADLRAAFEKP